MSALARQAQRTTTLFRAQSNTVSRRYASHGSDAEIATQMKNWRAISWMGLAVVAVGCAYNFISPNHHHVDKAYPYMNIRSKKFPWGDGDTPFLGHAAGLGPDDHAAEEGGQHSSKSHH
eukprot:TRINITY_DN747_c0_g1_i1.p1 TRINITY_DN747_c0_g1~~TRINITY_DN747_c0_g1_i1.p1  ORF type:complete len:119 (-),score=38.93 TRINITY_DN747_c0_g1_i1:166-522(-)